MWIFCFPHRDSFSCDYFSHAICLKCDSFYFVFDCGLLAFQNIVVDQLLFLLLASSSSWDSKTLQRPVPAGLCFDLLFSGFQTPTEGFSFAYALRVPSRISLPLIMKKKANVVGWNERPDFTESLEEACEVPLSPQESIPDSQPASSQHTTPEKDNVSESPLCSGGAPLSPVCDSPRHGAL